MVLLLVTAAVGSDGHKEGILAAYSGLLSSRPNFLKRYSFCSRTMHRWAGYFVKVVSQSRTLLFGLQ